MSFRCADLEAALDADDVSLRQAASAHAAGCAACGGRLRAWEQLLAAAPALRREWESPGLWPRIEAALHAAAAGEAVAGPVRPARLALPGRWPAWVGLAAAVVLALTGAALILRGLRPPATVSEQPPVAGPDRLLTEPALRRVEQAEAEYARSIEELSKVAERRLAAAGSPLLLSYREKLLVLDSAIAECRAQIERNRFNAHLRRELLSAYQEKKRTLEQVTKGEADAS